MSSKTKNEKTPLEPKLPKIKLTKRGKKIWKKIQKHGSCLAAFLPIAEDLDTLDALIKKMASKKDALCSICSPSSGSINGSEIRKTAGFTDQPHAKQGVWMFLRYGKMPSVKPMKASN